VRPVAPKINTIVIATPIRAVRSGMPAARSDPRVRKSTTKAMTTPSTSTMLKCGVLWENASPPTDTVEPGMLDCSAAVSRCRASSVLGSISALSTLSWTAMMAASLSAAITPLTSLSNGEVALSTWSMRP
jgi:hypothetical protein